MANPYYMKLSEFEALDHDEKLDYTVDTGTFLMSRHDDEIRVHLFDIDGFYVEVISLKENGQVVMIKSFVDTDKLTPYLKQMDLSVLLS